MQLHAEKEPYKRKSAEHIQSQEPAIPQKDSVLSQPVSTTEDIQAGITDRAYTLYAERGYRQGYALDDWLEAEREVLGLGCNA
ncbi:MAG: DUF2934 domain-containing protein [Nitrospira sp.]|nr:DUF2934 domain-containing protein [Nitrospira sp.]